MNNLIIDYPIPTVLDFGGNNNFFVPRSGDFFPHFYVDPWQFFTPPQISFKDNIKFTLKCKRFVSLFKNESFYSKNIPDECSICLQNFSKKRNIKIGETSCHHIFHMKCIYEWLSSQESNAHCPLCRTCQVKNKNNDSIPTWTTDILNQFRV